VESSTRIKSFFASENKFYYQKKKEKALKQDIVLTFYLNIEQKKKSI